MIIMVYFLYVMFKLIDLFNDGLSFLSLFDILLIVFHLLVGWSLSDLLFILVS